MFLLTFSIINNVETQTTGLVLTKDEKIDLTKGNAGLSAISVGCGWDTASAGAAMDIDAFAVCLRGTDAPSAKWNGQNSDVLYFKSEKIGGKLAILGGAIIHTGDNLTGEGDGDDETINLDLSRIPEDVQSVLVCANVYDAQARGQHFGKAKNCFARVYDTNTKAEIGRYDLSEDYSGKTAIVLCSVYRHNGEWKFQALGEGKAGSIEDVANAYKA